MELRHHQFDRITFDPEKCSGKACIRGLRIPVSSILSYLSSGMTTEEILEEWPELTHHDLSQALAYAASVLEERVVSFEEPTMRSFPDLAETLMAIGRRCSSLPDLDTRSAGETLGYDEKGTFR